MSRPEHEALRSERPARPPIAARWSLDPDVVYLNHGGFGATPIEVLARQTELRARLERQPSLFLVRELEGLLDEARSALATFVGAQPAELAFVHNATTAVNAVVGSLELEAGDELLTTTHEYNACRNVLQRYADRAGARVVAAPVPFPIRTEDEVVQAVVDAITSRTRLALIDHVTSPTGLVLPIERIARELGGRGIPLLADGAHAPGMVDLDLRALADAGVTWYAANCHKWVCSPKVGGFLWVRHDRQHEIRPAVTSHGANSRRRARSRFQLEFDWPGTQDPTAWLCIPEAIGTMAALVPGGWDEIRVTNRALALAARDILVAALDIGIPAPDSMMGALVAVPLGDARDDDSESPDPVARDLFDHFGIEVPVFSWPDPALRILRVSAQLYVTRDDITYLSRCLSELLSP